MGGVAGDADAGFDVGVGVVVLMLGISAGGVLIEEELGSKRVSCVVGASLQARKD